MALQYVRDAVIFSSSLVFFQSRERKASVLFCFKVMLVSSGPELDLRPVFNSGLLGLNLGHRLKVDGCSAFISCGLIFDSLQISLLILS